MGKILEENWNLLGTFKHDHKSLDPERYAFAEELVIATQVRTLLERTANTIQRDATGRGKVALYTRMVIGSISTRAAGALCFTFPAKHC